MTILQKFNETVQTTNLHHYLEEYNPLELRFSTAKWVIHAQRLAPWTSFLCFHLKAYEYY